MLQNWSHTVAFRPRAKKSFESIALTTRPRTHQKTRTTGFCTDGVDGVRGAVVWRMRVIRSDVPNLRGWRQLISNIVISEKSRFFAIIKTKACLAQNRRALWTKNKILIDLHFSLLGRISSNLLLVLKLDYYIRLRVSKKLLQLA